MMAQPEGKLRDVLTAIVEEQYPNATDVKVKPVSSNGANYSSNLFEATIITPEENIEVFAKVCKLGDAFKSDESKSVFELEKYMYTNIANAYEKLQDKLGIADERYVFPKYYKTNATDQLKIVIMENLTAKGYSCLDRFKIIDWKYAAKCAETLAKYHALSFALSKYDPEEFKKAGEFLTLPPLDVAGFEGLADGAMAAVYEEDGEKLAKLLEGSVGWSKFKELSDPLKTMVIIHGDYRASNLMHKEVNGDLHVIPVDYQTARLGCPASDLIYFILMGTDQQFRQAYFHQLLDYYYDQLSRSLRRLGLVPEEVYSREEFDSDVREKIPIGIALAAMTLPFITVEPEHAPDFKANEFVPPPNEQFAVRFRGVMQDFKQWGFI